MAERTSTLFIAVEFPFYDLPIPRRGDEHRVVRMPTAVSNRESMVFQNSNLITTHLQLITLCISMEKGSSSAIKSIEWHLIKFYHIVDINPRIIGSRVYVLLTGAAKCKDRYIKTVMFFCFSKLLNTCVWGRSSNG